MLPGVQPRTYHRFRDISSQNFDCSPFDLRWANPWAKGHQKGRWSTIHVDLPSYKISARSRKRSTRYALPKFFTFWPLGANPCSKVHQKGRWPAGHYQPTKFHHPPSTRAGDIPYQTNKQTVNDISTTCLSTCVDNKTDTQVDYSTVNNSETQWV